MCPYIQKVNFICLYPSYLHEKRIDNPTLGKTKIEHKSRKKNKL